MDDDIAKKFSFLNDKQTDKDKMFENLKKYTKDGKLPDMNQIKELMQKFKPVTSEEYLKDPANVPLDPEGGLLIQPEQGFVFKTKEARTGIKFFINITHHPVIDKPEQKEIVEYENEEAIRIPMSVGNIREDFDNKKEPCKVLDCIMHPDICKEMMKKSDNDLLSFFSDLLIAYIHQKHKVELTKQSNTLSIDFKLPKMKYKGNYVDFQRVRGKKNPKIDVISEEKIKESTMKPEEKEILMNSSGVRKPEWTLEMINDENQICEFDPLALSVDESKGLHYTLKLPLLVTGKLFIIKGRYINLQVSQLMIVVTCGKIYHIKFMLPIEIEGKKTEAIFMTKTRELAIRVYFKGEMEEQASEEATVKESILEKNRNKVVEQRIEIKSDLLDDIF